MEYRLSKFVFDIRCCQGPDLPVNRNYGTPKILLVELQVNNNPKDLFPTAVPWDDHPKVLADKAMVSDALIVNAPNPFVCDNHSVGQQVVHAGKTDKLCKLFHRLDACRFRGVHCA